MILAVDTRLVMVAVVIVLAVVCLWIATRGLRR